MAPSSTPLKGLLIGLTLLCLASLTTAANPVQIGLSSAVSSSPILSRWGLARGARQRSSKQQSLRTVLPVSNDDEEDDSTVQSAFWHASTPAEVYQSRHIEFPVSRQRSSNQDEEPECELEFLESQMYGGNLLVSRPTQKRMAVAALSPAPSRSSAVHHLSDKSSKVGVDHREDEKKHSEDLEEAQASTTTHHGLDDVRGGVAARPLQFWEAMVCGAVSRSVAQTIMHPANTMKTMLQSQRGAPSVVELLRPSAFRRLTYGAGANFLLSFPTGAVNFAVLEFVRHHMGQFVQSTPFLAERQEQLGAGLDFMSSALSTIACSVVATPQMMITDNIMAGNYPNLVKATQGLYAKQGVVAFYRGWWPGLVGKIPSYALTWTLFQQLKQARNRISNRPAKNWENSVMGCLASGTTVCIMIPMDTIKTRLVTQAGSVAAGNIPYKGIIDCAVRVAKEEGIIAFYRGLPPRLVSVVPMIGIQFGVYEAMKKVMMRREIERQSTLKLKIAQRKIAQKKLEEAAAAKAAAKAAEESKEEFEDIIMQVGASHGNPLPAPHMHDHEQLEQLKDLQKKSKKAEKLKKLKGAGRN